MTKVRNKTSSSLALEELKRRNDLESLRKYLAAENCFPTAKDPATAPITIEELKKLVRIWKLNERRNFWKQNSERDDIVSSLIQYAEQNHMDNYRHKSNHKKVLAYEESNAPTQIKPLPPTELKPSLARGGVSAAAANNIRNFCGLKYFNRENNPVELTMSSRFFEFPDLPDRVDNVVDRWRSEDFDLNESDFFGYSSQNQQLSPDNNNINNNNNEEDDQSALPPTNFPQRTGTTNSGNNGQNVASGIKNKVKIMKQRNLALHLMNYSASNDFKRQSQLSSANSNSSNANSASGAASSALSMKALQTFLNLADSDDIKTISKVMIALSNISSDSMIRSLLLEMNSMHKITNMLPYLRGKITHYAASLFFYYFSIDKESEDRIYNASSIFLQANYNSKDAQIRLITLYTLNNLMPCIDRQRIAECICRALYSLIAQSSSTHRDTVNTATSGVSGGTGVNSTSNSGSISNTGISNHILLMDKATIAMYLHIIHNTCWFSNVHHILFNCHILDVIAVITQYAIHYKYSDILLSIVKVLQSLLQLPDQFVILTTSTPSSTYLPSNPPSNPNSHPATPLPPPSSAPSANASNSSGTTWIFSYLYILQLLLNYELSSPPTAMTTAASTGASATAPTTNSLDNPTHQLLKIMSLLTSLPTIKRFLRNSELFACIAKILLTRSAVTNIVAKEVNKCFLAMTLIHPEEKLVLPTNAAQGNSSNQNNQQAIKDYYLEKLVNDGLITDAIFVMVKSPNVHNSTKAMSLKVLQNILTNATNVKSLLTQTVEAMMKLLNTLTDSTSTTAGGASVNAHSAGTGRISMANNGMGQINAAPLPALLHSDLRLSVMTILYNVACHSFGKDYFLKEHLHYKFVDMLFATKDLSFKSKILQILVLLTSPTATKTTEPNTKIESCKQCIEDLLQYSLIQKLTTQLLSAAAAVVNTPNPNNTTSKSNRHGNNNNNNAANNTETNLENYGVWKDIAHLLLAVVAYSSIPLSLPEHRNIVQILRIITTTPPAKSNQSINSSDPYYDINAANLANQQAEAYYLLVAKQYQEILENTGKIMKFLSYSHQDFVTMDPIIRNMLQYTNSTTTSMLLANPSAVTTTSTATTTVSATNNQASRPTSTAGRPSTSTTATTNHLVPAIDVDGSTRKGKNDANGTDPTVDKDEEMLENIAIILHNLICADSNVPYFLQNITYSNVIIQSLRHGKRLTTLSILIQCIRVLSCSSEYILLLSKHNLLSDLIVIALLRTNHEEMKLICSEIFYNMLCHNHLRLQLLQSGDIYWALMRLGRYSNSSHNEVNANKTAALTSMNHSNSHQLLQEVKLICIRTIFDLSISPAVFAKWLWFQKQLANGIKPINRAKISEHEEEEDDYEDDLEQDASLDIGEESVEVDEKLEVEYESILEAIRKHHVLSFLKDITTNLSSQYLYYVLQIIHNLLHQFQDLAPLSITSSFMMPNSTPAIPATNAMNSAKAAISSSGSVKVSTTSVDNTANANVPMEESTSIKFANHEIIAAIRISADAIQRTVSHIPTIQIALIVLLKCAQYIRTIPTTSGGGLNSLAVNLINEFVNIDLVEILKKQIGLWYNNMELCLYVTRFFFELTKYPHYVKSVNYEDLYPILQASYYSIVTDENNDSLSSKANPGNTLYESNANLNIPINLLDVRLELLENNLGVLMQYMLSDLITATRLLALSTVFPLPHATGLNTKKVFFPLLTILLKDAFQPKLVSIPASKTASQKFHSTLMAVRASVYFDQTRKTRVGGLGIPQTDAAGENNADTPIVPTVPRGRASMYVRDANALAGGGGAGGNTSAVMISPTEFLSMMRGTQPHPWRIQGMGLTLLGFFIEEYASNTTTITTGSNTASTTNIGSAVSSTYSTLLDEELAYNLLKQDFIEYLPFRNNFLFVLSAITTSNQYAPVFCGALSSGSTNNSRTQSLIHELFTIFTKHLNFSKGNNRQEQSFEYVSCFLRNLSLHTNALPSFLQFAATSSSLIVSVIKELCESLTPAIAFDLTIFFFHIANNLAVINSGNNNNNNNVATTAQEMNSLTPKFVLAMIQLLLSYSEQMMAFHQQQLHQQFVSPSRGVTPGSAPAIASALPSSSTTPTGGSSFVDATATDNANRNQLTNLKNAMNSNTVLNDEELLNIQYINKYTISMILNKYSFVNGVDPLFIQNMLSYMQSNIMSLIPEIMQGVTFKSLPYIKNVVATEFFTVKDSSLVEFIVFPPNSFYLPSTVTPQSTETKNSYQCWQPIVSKEFKKPANIAMQSLTQKPLLFTQVELLDGNHLSPLISTTTTTSTALNIVPFQKIIKSFDLIKENQPDASAISEETEQDDEDDIGTGTIGQNNTAANSVMTIKELSNNNNDEASITLPPIADAYVPSSSSAKSIEISMIHNNDIEQSLENYDQEKNGIDEVFANKSSVNELMDNINQHFVSMSTSVKNESAKSSQKNLLGNEQNKASSASMKSIQSVKSTTIVHAPITSEPGSFQSPRSQRIRQQSSTSSILSAKSTESIKSIKDSAPNNPPPNSSKRSLHLPQSSSALNESNDDYSMSFEDGTSLASPTTTTK